MKIPLVSPKTLASCLWVLLMATPSAVLAAPPDLTAQGVIATIDRSSTYNLGATGLRGWIYVNRANIGDVGLITDESRQILVTIASAPANAELAVDDVILGAIAADSGTVPDFSSDCRKAFANAITDAEKTGAGTLRVKRWRAGVTTEQNITIPILGNYTATAPFNCPKSALILAQRPQQDGRRSAGQPELSNKRLRRSHPCLALLARREIRRSELRHGPDPSANLRPQPCRRRPLKITASRSGTGPTTSSFSPSIIF